MGLITLLIFIAIVGLLVWVLMTFVPMPNQFKTALVVVAVVLVLLVVLRAIFYDVPDVQVPKVRVE